jgi:hypothetical protein
MFSNFELGYKTKIKHFLTVHSPKPVTTISKPGPWSRNVVTICDPDSNGFGFAAVTS